MELFFFPYLRTQDPRDASLTFAPPIPSPSNLEDLWESFRLGMDLLQVLYPIPSPFPSYKPNGYFFPLFLHRPQRTVIDSLPIFHAVSPGFSKGDMCSRVALRLDSYPSSSRTHDRSISSFFAALVLILLVLLYKSLDLTLPITVLSEAFCPRSLSLSALPLDAL